MMPFPKKSLQAIEAVIYIAGSTGDGPVAGKEIAEALGTSVTLRVTAATLRSVEHNGGLDAYLTGQADSKLTAEAVRLKRQIKRKIAKSEKAA